MNRLGGVALTLVVCLAGCTPSGDSVPLVEGIRVGERAPEIVGTTLDGKTFRLSDHKGKIVVLDFWATWCGPCVRAMPAMKKLHEKYKDQPFVLVGISQDGDRDKVVNFVDSNQINWLQIHDRALTNGSIGPIGAKWEVSSIPRVVVIDHRGVVRYVPNSESQIERAVKNLLSDLAASS